jgi:hypothetical protein
LEELSFCRAGEFHISEPRTGGLAYHLAYSP